MQCLTRQPVCSGRYSAGNRRNEIYEPQLQCALFFWQVELNGGVILAWLIKTALHFLTAIVGVATVVIVEMSSLEMEKRLVSEVRDLLQYTITPDSYVVDGIASKRKWSGSSKLFKTPWTSTRQQQPIATHKSKEWVVSTRIPVLCTKNSGITSGQTLEVARMKGMLFSTSQKRFFVVFFYRKWIWAILLCGKCKFLFE